GLREGAGDEGAVEGCAGGLLLRWPGARLQLESPPASCCPPPQPAPVGPSHRVQAERLRWAVESTLFAAGPGSRRYCLESVLWEAEPDRLRLVATDNRRLAVAELHALGRCAQPGPPRLLPARGARLLAR